MDAHRILCEECDEGPVEELALSLGVERCARCLEGEDLFKMTRRAIFSDRHGPWAREWLTPVVQHVFGLRDFRDAEGRAVVVLDPAVHGEAA